MTAGRGFVAKANPNAGVYEPYRVGIYNGKYEFFVAVSDTERYAIAGGSPSESTRTVVVFKWSSSDGYGYVYEDGALVLSGFLTTSSLLSTTGNLYIGRRGGMSNFYNGDIYAVLIYNRALSDTEISKLSEDPFDPNNVPKDGLVAWWDFNKADWSNGVLPDLSGNGNDGTIYGVVQRDALVKRGTGDLPSYDLLWSWVCDGIDDYVYVDDWKGQFLTKNYTVSIWTKQYGGKYTYTGIWNQTTPTKGYYDATYDKWFVPASEGAGYFWEYKYSYDENRYGRPLWLYVRGVAVADNTLTDPVFKVEFFNVRTGEIIAEKVFYANELSTDPTGTVVKVITKIFIPYSEWGARLYSYGNVDFWIYSVTYEGWRHALLYNNQIILQMRYDLNTTRVQEYDSSMILYSFSLSGYSSYTAKDWRLYSFVRDYNNLAYGGYIDNGTLVAQKTIDYELTVSGGIYIGKYDTLNAYVGEIASIMVFDRPLDSTEITNIYNRKFVLDGLVHWFVIDENGNLVDLVTGKSYAIQGNPYIRRLYDDNGILNSGTGVVVFDIIKDEKSQ